MHFLYRPYSSLLQQQDVKLPVRGVQWRAFWRGSVYANPVNDVIGTLLDLSARASVNQERSFSQLRIVFEETSIVVETAGNDPIIYPYADIRGLRFYCAPFANVYERKDRVNTINFRTAVGETHYYFVYNQMKLKNICTFLLQQNVLFKEYLNGVRAHLGRTDYSYQEIQDLKKEHGLVW